MRSDFCSLLHSQVSKNDNLAGIAVKYGVSVSDIKKANGLLSDNGMFAKHTLLIPLDQRGARYALISTKKRNPLRKTYQTRRAFGIA